MFRGLISVPCVHHGKHHLSFQSLISKTCSIACKSWILNNRDHGLLLEQHNSTSAVFCFLWSVSLKIYLSVFKKHNCTLLMRFCWALICFSLELGLWQSVLGVEFLLACSSSAGFLGSFWTLLPEIFCLFLLWFEVQTLQAVPSSPLTVFPAQVALPTLGMELAAGE